jgi:hypothetical protein
VRRGSPINIASAKASPSRSLDQRPMDGPLKLATRVLPAGSWHRSVCRQHDRRPVRQVALAARGCRHRNDDRRDRKTVLSVPSEMPSGGRGTTGIHWLASHAAVTPLSTASRSGLCRYDKPCRVSMQQRFNPELASVVARCRARALAAGELSPPRIGAVRSVFSDDDDGSLQGGVVTVATRRPSTRLPVADPDLAVQ